MGNWELHLYHNCQNQTEKEEESVSGMSHPKKKCHLPGACLK